MSLLYTSNYNRKTQILQSSLTSLYMSVFTLTLIYYNSWNNIGKYSSLSLIASCFVMECLKLLLWQRSQKSLNMGEKSGKPRKLNLKNKLKCSLLIGLMVGVYYLLAVLFGAPFLSEHEETFMFALLLTTITIVPTCFHLGADCTVALLTDLTNVQEDLYVENFKHVICITLFGAWLGAIVIPLDWDRPWQVWPIPCCFGALIGYNLSHLFILFKFVNVLSKLLSKKTGKYSL